MLEIDSILVPILYSFQAIPMKYDKCTRNFDVRIATNLQIQLVILFALKVINSTAMDVIKIL